MYILHIQANVSQTLGITIYIIYSGHSCSLRPQKIVILLPTPFSYNYPELQYNHVLTLCHYITNISGRSRVVSWFLCPFKPLKTIHQYNKS